MIKEIGVLVTGIGLNLGINHLGSEFMWSKCKGIVRHYALEKEKEFYELSNESKINK